ncbi:MAG: PIN domain-containing protein [Actinophytocola sp.]|nr:PIN domain-containing protein [Actinophytocola sp.]
MRVVVPDASAVVAALVDSGPDGEWAATRLSGADLIAPHQMPFETANILRRQELAGEISADQAVQAHVDLLDLPVQYFPYYTLAHRSWQLRRNLSIYDASYVALAELASANLVTLDRRIARAPGVRGAVVTPES